MRLQWDCNETTMRLQWDYHKSVKSGSSVVLYIRTYRDTWYLVLRSIFFRLPSDSIVSMYNMYNTYNMHNTYNTYVQHVLAQPRLTSAHLVFRTSVVLQYILGILLITTVFALYLVPVLVSAVLLPTTTIPFRMSPAVIDQSIDQQWKHLHSQHGGAYPWRSDVVPTAGVHQGHRRPRDVRVREAVRAGHHQLEGAAARESRGRHDGHYGPRRWAGECWLCCHLVGLQILVADNTAVDPDNSSHRMPPPFTDEGSRRMWYREVSTVQIYSDKTIAILLIGDAVQRNCDKMIAILLIGDRWWPQKAKQQEDKISKKFTCNIWEKRNERPNVGVFSTIIGVGTVLRLERDAWSIVKMTKASNQWVCPPPNLPAADHAFWLYLFCRLSSSWLSTPCPYLSALGSLLRSLSATKYDSGFTRWVPSLAYALRYWLAWEAMRTCCTWTFLRSIVPTTYTDYYVPYGDNGGCSLDSAHKMY